MSIAVDAIVDVLTLAVLGVHMLVGAFQGAVAPKPAASDIVEIEMTLEAPQAVPPVSGDGGERR